MLDIPSFGVLWGKCWISNLLVFYGGNAGWIPHILVYYGGNAGWIPHILVYYEVNAGRYFCGINKS